MICEKLMEKWSIDLYEMVDGSIRIDASALEALKGNG